MFIEVDHEEGQDFGSVTLTPGEDDRVELSGYGGRSEMRLRFSLYSGEARELIEKLEPIAATPEP
jgi:hypothetical protein